MGEAVGKESFFNKTISNFEGLNSVLIGNENGLFLFDLINNKFIEKKTRMEITSVGIDCTDDSKIVAVGDMVGNAYIFDVNDESLDKNESRINNNFLMPV